MKGFTAFIALVLGAGALPLSLEPIEAESGTEKRDSISTYAPKAEATAISSVSPSASVSQRRTFSATSRPLSTKPDRNKFFDGIAELRDPVGVRLEVRLAGTDATVDPPVSPTGTVTERKKFSATSKPLTTKPDRGKFFDGIADLRDPVAFRSLPTRVDATINVTVSVSASTTQRGKFSATSKPLNFKPDRNKFFDGIAELRDPLPNRPRPFSVKAATNRSVTLSSSVSQPTALLLNGLSTPSAVPISLVAGPSHKPKASATVPPSGKSSTQDVVTRIGPSVTTQIATEKATITKIQKASTTTVHVTSKVSEKDEKKGKDKNNNKDNGKKKGKDKDNKEDNSEKKEKDKDDDSNVGGLVGGILGAAGAVAGAGVQAASNAGKAGSAGSLRGNLFNTASNVVGGAGNVVGKAANTAAQVGSSAANIAGGATGVIGNAANAAAAGTNAAANLAGTAGNAIAAGSNAAAGIAGTAPGIIGNAAAGVAGAAPGVVGNAAAAAVNAKVNAAAQAGNMAGAAANAGANAAANVAGSVPGIIGNAADAGSNAAADAVGQVANGATDAGSKAPEIIAKYLPTGIDRIFGQILQDPYLASDFATLQAEKVARHHANHGANADEIMANTHLNGITFGAEDWLDTFRAVIKEAANRKFAAEGGLGQISKASPSRPSLDDLWKSTKSVEDWANLHAQHDRAGTPWNSEYPSWEDLQGYMKNIESWAKSGPQGKSVRFNDVPEIGPGAPGRTHSSLKQWSTLEPPPLDIGTAAGGDIPTGPPSAIQDMLGQLSKTHWPNLNPPQLPPSIPPGPPLRPPPPLLDDFGRRILRLVNKPGLNPQTNAAPDLTSDLQETLERYVREKMGQQQGGQAKEGSGK